MSDARPRGSSRRDDARVVGQLVAILLAFSALVVLGLYLAGSFEAEPDGKNQASVAGNIGG